jgi:hypothetical protein
MMIGSRTSWRNELESHTMMKYVPCLIASGRANSAMIVKIYAIHMVPTTRVMRSPNLALKRTNGFG